MNIRSLAVVGLAFAAVAANAAFIFDFSSKGTFGITGTTVQVNDPLVLDDASTSAVDSVVYNYQTDGTAGSGTIWLSNTDSIGFSFSGSVTPVSANSNALNGLVVSFAGGTGSLAGYTGTGSISNTTSWSQVAARGNSRTTFYAELEAVPEPASMAALAVGALGMLRKRRSK